MPDVRKKSKDQDDATDIVRELNREASRTPRSLLRSTGAFAFELLKVLIISLVIIVPIRYFVVQPFYVVGASMEPGLHDYEYIVIDEISYRFNDVKRGDIVVLKDVDDRRQFLIKRVIGLPGEEIEIDQRGDVIITNASHPNGWVLHEDYLGDGISTNGKNSWALGDDEYFVMGDNRSASLDSRIFGPITKEHIVGRAWIRAWPFDKLTHFSEPTYSTEGE